MCCSVLLLRPRVHGLEAGAGVRDVVVGGGRQEVLVLAPLRHGRAGRGRGEAAAGGHGALPQEPVQLVDDHLALGQIPRLCKCVFLIPYKTSNLKRLS